MATYVKAWAFFAVIVVLAMTITSSALLYMEAQNTNGLVLKLTKDFETKMVNITTNNSVLISNAMATFQTQLATVNTQVETLATAKGNLEAQVASINTQMLTWQTMYTNQLGVTTTINTTWTNFLKAFNKGLLKLEETNEKISDGKANFTEAYNALGVSHTSAVQNATYASANYDSSRSLYNTSFTFFQSANNKVTQNWTNAYVTMYVNLNPMVQNFTYEMGKTCYYLKNASYCYSIADAIHGDENRTKMCYRWSLYNISYVSYTNTLVAIDTMIGAL